MSDLTATIQRVLDLDREETPGETRVSVYDDKYMFIVRSDSSMEVLRYGETWWTPDRGANAVRSLVHFADERRTEGVDLARALVAERARVDDLALQLAAAVEQRARVDAALADCNGLREATAQERDALRADLARATEEESRAWAALTGEPWTQTRPEGSLLAAAERVVADLARVTAERDTAHAIVSSGIAQVDGLRIALSAAREQALVALLKDAHDVLDVIRQADMLQPHAYDRNENGQSTSDDLRAVLARIDAATREE